MASGAPFNTTFKMILTSKQKTIVLLFLIMIPISEIYVLFDDHWIRPWLDRRFNYKIPLSNYVDELMDSVCWVIISAIFFLFMEVKRVTALQFVVRVNFAISVFDLIMYLVNHNKATPYLFAYSCVGLITFVMYWYFDDLKKLRSMLPPKNRKRKTNKDIEEKLFTEHLKIN